MKKILVGIVLIMSYGCAFADDGQGLLDTSTIGASAVSRNGAQGGIATIDLRNGPSSLSGSAGEISTQGTNGVVTADLITTWDNDPWSGNHASGKYFATEHSLYQDPQHLSFSPVATCVVSLSDSRKTRLGACLSPWSLEVDHVHGTQGNAGGLHLLAEQDLGDRFRLRFSLEGKGVYGSARSVSTSDSSSSVQSCNPSVLGSCQTITTDVTSEAAPGFKQSGLGSQVRAALGVDFKIGPTLVTAEAIDDNDQMRGVNTHYISGNGESVSFKQNSTEFRLGMSYSFGAD